MSGVWIHLMVAGIRLMNEIDPGKHGLPGGFACRIAAAVSGRMGASLGGKSARILNAYFENSMRSSPGAKTSFMLPTRGLISAQGEGWICQRPERSGLPSRVRGAGPVRFGLPFAVRGIPGVG